jgi:hypothetical protein
MTTNQVHYGMVPIGSHAGLFAVHVNLTAVKGPSENEKINLGMKTMSHKRQPVLYVTIDSTNPPTETEIESFLKANRESSIGDKIYIIVQAKLTKVPSWVKLANWIIQYIDLADWRGIPCNELHAKLTEPMGDPVIMLTQIPLYLVESDRADAKDLFDFLLSTTNPWRLGIHPTKRLKVSI